MFHYNVKHMRGFHKHVTIFRFSGLWFYFEKYSSWHQKKKKPHRNEILVKSLGKSEIEFEELGLQLMFFLLLFWQKITYMRWKYQDKNWCSKTKTKNLRKYLFSYKRITQIHPLNLLTRLNLHAVFKSRQSELVYIHLFFLFFFFFTMS